VNVRTSFALLLVLAPLCGGDPPPPETRLIDLNVIAMDSHGQPVTDLSQDDFKITDAGKPQQIVFFRHYDSKLISAPPASPNEFSNRRGGNIARATVIFFDLLNEAFATRGTAASQLVKYLQSMEKPDYLFLYLLTVDGRLYAVHGVPDASTPDASSQEPWTRQIKPLLDDALREVTRVRPVDVDVAVRVQLTFRELEELGVELSRIPGRKNIVWITDGVPVVLGPVRSDTGDFVDFTPLIRALSDAMDRSGISLYPVRQVMLGSPDAVPDYPDASEGRGATPRSGIGSLDTVDQFAGLTGGRPDAGKDIGAAIQQAMNDVRTSYQIGYDPPAKNWDGKFHKLRVTCTRKGVRIQAKTGYYAFPEPSGARAEQAVHAAAGARFDAAEIGLRATVPPSPDAQKARLEARIDANDVALTRDGDQFSGLLRMALVRYFAGKPPEISPLTSVEIHQTAPQREQALRDGIPVSQDFSLQDNVQAVRLIVFDSGSNTVGSVTIAVRHAP
jgi:VWFA-related protein